MPSKQEGERPQFDPEVLQELKDTIFTAWAFLPPEHQATVTMILTTQVLRGEWGEWLRGAVTLWSEGKLGMDFPLIPGMPIEAIEQIQPTFPVISISRGDLQRFFTAEEVAQFTDQEIVQIAEELGTGFADDPGFWYTVEETGRRILSERHDWTAKPYAKEGSDFSHWMQQVDEAVWQIALCSVYDLPDYDFYSMFQDGASSAEAANEALSEAGFDPIE